MKKKKLSKTCYATKSLRLHTTINKTSCVPGPVAYLFMKEKTKDNNRIETEKRGINIHQITATHSYNKIQNFSFVILISS